MQTHSQDQQKLLKLLLQKKGIGLKKVNTIPRRNSDSLVPLSFAQEQLWLLYQLEDKGYTYNMAFRFQIEGNLEVELFKKSLETIMQRHEVLHTSFQEIDGVLLQIIHPEIKLNFPLVNLENLAPSEQAQELTRLTDQEIYTPFELTQAPLLRTFVVKLREDSYVFFFSLHHSVFDGWSMKVFLEELSTLYQAFLKQEANPLPQLPIQYGDFALWQRQQLQGDKLTTQVNYWKQKLSGSPPLLDLPTDKPRPPIQTFIGNRCQFHVNQELTEKLKNLSQQLSVTLNMTLLTAFSVLLYRYSHQEDMVIGIPTGNRQFPEIEPLIGCFINTLAIRTHLTHNISFQALLAEVKQVVLEAYDHQDLPLEKVVEAVNPQRNVSYNPLFQVMFSWEDMLHIDEVCMGDLRLNPVKIEAMIAQFDLTLAMQETPAGLLGFFDYNLDLFNPETIERMIRHFQILLEGIVTVPEQSIGTLPLLTQDEKNCLIEWNDTERTDHLNGCIHQFFEEQVKRSPDAIALVFGQESLTYQELNTQGNQLAHYLQSLGVEKEVLVGLYLDRSPSIIVALLAVLKAGGAYVPLDPDYPQQRLAYIAQDSQFKLLITQKSLENTLPVEGVKVICIDDFEFKNQDSENPISTVQPENLIYLLYTSGSTGIPKGVMLTHEALVSHSWAISEVFGLTCTDRVLQFSSFSFDVAAEEIFSTWLTGGCVVLRPKEIFPTITDFNNFVQYERLSVLNLTSAYWHEWTIAISHENATVPPSVRLVVVGGDVVSPATVTLWKKWVGKRVNCLNAYGPTEASVTSTVYNLFDHDTKRIHSVLIGRPLANTKTYILDENLQPVPIGVRGELHLSGPRLARGYLNRPDLTAKKFINNPCSFTNHSRLYKTGDIACYLSDGNIELFGRIDNQVKIRGFRIELGEIEIALAESPDVQANAVIVREDEPHNKQLVAYIVPENQSIDSRKLRDFLKQKLPDYMIPSLFIQLEELPLTNNGKVDRKALPIPAQSNDSKMIVPPRTITEKIVTEIWQDVLGLEKISIFDNFFELGGHSLKATQVISRLREKLSINIPLNSLFSEPTVAGLSENLETNLSIAALINPDQSENWQAETTLDPSIQPPNLPYQFPHKPVNILLTGATGFLGIHLLADLLDKTEANIYCLIRSDHPEKAQEKIHKKLKTFQLGKDNQSHRIIPVIGDLSEKYLGLSEPEFLELANKLDVIYHNAASTNTIYPYSLLKPTNVLGTQEILRLACLSKTKPVHFISTTSVFSPSYAQGNLIKESDPLGMNHGLTAGYSQSKWVAEKLVMEARNRGLPVTLFRAARIIGHSQTGICNTEDLFCRIIKGCIQLGMTPDFGDLTDDLTPVDYVSGAIVHLASQENSLGKAFHLLSPTPTLNNDLFDSIREIGYPLASVPFEQWRSHLREECKQNTDQALYPVLDLFFDDNLEAGEPLNLDCQNTLNGLKDTPLNFPPIDKELLQVYLDYFTQSGFLNGSK